MKTFDLAMMLMIVGSIGMSVCAYESGKTSGVEQGRHEQAALTPSACRHMVEVAEEALENARRAGNGWLKCDLEREALLQEAKEHADGGLTFPDATTQTTARKVK